MHMKWTVRYSTLAPTLGLAAAILLGGCKSAPAPVITPVPDNSAAATQGPNDRHDREGDRGSERRGERSGERAGDRADERRDSRSSPAGQGQPRNEPAIPPASLTVPSGTQIVVQTTEALSASHNQVGDGFTGVLSEPVSVDNRVVFPRGTQVSGTVAAAKGRGRFKGAGDLGIVVNSIGGTRVETSEYEQASKGKGKRTGVLVGGGAGLGALIGGLAGGGKGALIGGLAGAGAGTAGAAYTGNNDVVIPSESLINFTLQAPVTVR